MGKVTLDGFLIYSITDLLLALNEVSNVFDVENVAIIVIPVHFLKFVGVN